LLLLLLSPGPAALAAGQIVAPDNGSCHGPASLPVYVCDSFDPSLERAYTPRGGLSKLFGSDPTGAGPYGAQVLLFGDRLAVGAPDNYSYRPGAVYVHRLIGDRWVEEQKLPAQAVGFGRALVAAGEELIVGSRDGVFVYVFEHGSWTSVQRLADDDAPSYTRFGEALATTGDTLFVGAPGGAGAVYVFGREDGRWVETDRLVGSDVGSGDSFATAVAADGDTLIVGAFLSDFRASQSGAAYVFERAGDRWLETQKITGEDVHTASYFGNALSIAGDVLVAGARNATNPGPHAGAAYVFERRGGIWVQTRKLRDTGSVSHGAFGSSVHASPERLLVGAPWAGTRGAVMLYRRTLSGDWAPERIQNRFDRFGDAFGAAVFAVGDVLAFGEADGNGLGFGSGAAYVDGALPPSTYEMHGDYNVTLELSDERGIRDGDSVSFVIDLRPPNVYRYRVDELTIPTSMPFSDLFYTSDRDGATGGVVQERVVWDGCMLFDGFTYGNGDGFLTDETLVLDEPTVCDILRRCDRDEFRDPLLEVEAVDCAGNVGHQAKTVSVVPAFGLERCD
jgi:hypothetical protein